MKIEQGQLQIGNTIVNIDTTAIKDQIFIIGKNDQSYSINLNTGSSNPIQFDANQWKNGKNQDQATIISHVKSYIQENNLSWMKTIPIINFHCEGINSGKAYYEIEKERILFTKAYNPAAFTSNNRSDYKDAMKLHLTVHGKEFQNGKLAAIVGDDIYFIYNYKPNDVNTAGQGLGSKTSRIWKVDRTTGELKDSYGFFISDEDKNISDNLQMWQEGEKIFITRKAKEGKDQVIYCFKDLGIEQIRTEGNIPDSSLVQNLSQAHEIKSLRYDQAKFDSYTSTVVYANEITRSSQFTAYGIDVKTKRDYRYWIRNNEIIRANMPDSFKGSISDLVLIPIQNSKGREMYYFYSSQNKSLYRQVGRGIDKKAKITGPPGFGEIPVTKEAAQKAELVNLNSPIIYVFERWGHLFATINNGLIYSIDQDGKFDQQAISAEWVRQKGKYWIDNLKNIPQDKALSIFGLKTAHGENLKAWAVGGQLIIAPQKLFNVSIRFAGISNKIAYFFNPETGKLYQQEILDPSIWKNAFGQDGILDLERNFDKPLLPVLQNETFKSVSVLEGELLKLVTKEEGGAVLLVYKNKQVRLIGFTKEGNYDSLKDKYPHLGAVSVEKYEGDSSWYHFDLQIVFPGHSIKSYGNPQYLGTTSEGIYFTTDQGLVRYNAGEEKAALINNLNNESIKSIGDILVIKGNIDNQLNPFLLKDFNTIIFHGKSSIDHYKINLKEDTRKNKNTKRKVIFTNSDLNPDNSYGSDIIDLTFLDASKTQMTRQEDDLLIRNERNKIFIKNVFDNNVNHGYAEIFVNSQGWKIKTLLDLIKNIPQKNILEKEQFYSTYQVNPKEGKLYELYYQIDRLNKHISISGKEEKTYLNLNYDAITEGSSLTLSGGEGEDLYEIDLTDPNKPRLAEINIDNYDYRRAKDRLKLIIKDYNKVKLGRKERDLKIIYDQDKILIKDIFGNSNKEAYTHLELEFVGEQKTTTLEIDTIVNQWIALETPYLNQNINASWIPLSVRFSDIVSFI